MAKYGWGNCGHCGHDVCITKDGRAHRHGYIRVKRGHKIIGFGGQPLDQPLEGGHDHRPCPGSGKPVLNAFFKPKKSE